MSWFVIFISLMANDAEHLLHAYLLFADILPWISTYFLKEFFYVDHFFKSLHWICYNSASVVSFWVFGVLTPLTLSPEVRIEPSLPALVGEVSTTGPPGKYLSFHLNFCFAGSVCLLYWRASKGFMVGKKIQGKWHILMVQMGGQVEGGLSMLRLVVSPELWIQVCTQFLLG